MHFEFGFAQCAFGLLDFCFILGHGGFFLGLRLEDVFILRGALGLAINGIAQLRLTVKLDHQVAFFDAGSARDQLGNGQSAHLLASQKRRLDGAKAQSGAWSRRERRVT